MESTIESTENNESTFQYLRSYRLNGIAAIDLFATCMVSYIFALSIKQMCQLGTLWITLILFILLMVSAIIIHAVTETPTMLNHWLGLNTLDEVIEARKKRGEKIL